MKVNAEQAAVLAEQWEAEVYDASNIGRMATKFEQPVIGVAVADETETVELLLSVLAAAVLSGSDDLASMLVAGKLTSWTEPAEDFKVALYVRGIRLTEQ